MRRGCIAISQVKCDSCDRAIEYGQRYLAIESDEGGGIVRMCLQCCEKKGHAGFKRERGQELLTLFADESTSGQDAG